MKHRGNECQDANGKWVVDYLYLYEAFRESREGDRGERDSQT